MGGSRAQGVCLDPKSLQFVVSYKRLERGQFRLPHMDPSAMSVEIDATQLSMLLDGIDYSRVRRPPLWEPPARACPMDKSEAT